jgi:hypothetical protein
MLTIRSLESLSTTIGYSTSTFKVRSLHDKNRTNHSRVYKIKAHNRHEFKVFSRISG